MSPCLAFVQRVCRAFIKAGGHDATCYPNLTILSAKPGHILGQFKVEKRNLNRLNTLHGGVICSLTDTMGSLALASKGLYSTGVSTDIHTTFVKPANFEEEVIVEGKVISLGKTLATTRFELRHPKTDAILAYGSHTKFIGKALQHPENVGEYSKGLWYSSINLLIQHKISSSLSSSEFDETGEKVIKGKQQSDWADD